MLQKLTLAVLLGASLASAATVFISTDITGGQTQIDENHTSTWTLVSNGVDPTLSLGGGRFVMKAGQSTVDDIIFSLFEGTDATGTLVDSVTLTATAFCDQTPGNCSQFLLHQFFFTTPVALTTGTTYFATLTSVSPDTQSEAYFIKNDNFTTTDGAGTPIVPTPLDITPSEQTAPEPATLLLTGTALAAVGLLRRKSWKRSI